MQFVILGLLMMRPMSLYGLHAQFSAGPSLFYSASFGSIHRALRQLVTQGLVTVDDAPDSARGRKRHPPTPAGVDAWRQWMHEPIGGSNAETAMLAKVYLLGLLDDGDERRRAVAVLKASVNEELSALRAVAADLDATEIPEEYAGVFRYQRATLDYGLRSHELALAWLDDLV